MFGNTIVAGEKVIAYTEKNIRSLDDHFLASEKAEIRLMTEVIRNVLEPYRKSLLCPNWLTTFREAPTRYGASLSPIESIVYSFRQSCTAKREMKRLMQSRGTGQEEMKSVMLGVYGVLNQKLEENNASATEGFVFGPRPSTLDAVLFAHVAQLILTSDSLSYVLHRFPRLMAFYEWVMGSFFLGREAAGCSEDSGHVVAVPKVVLPSFLHHRVLPLKDAAPSQAIRVNANSVQFSTPQPPPTPPLSADRHESGTTTEGTSSSKSVWTIIRGFSWKSALANNYRTILFAAAVASMVAANFSYQKRKEKGPAINSIYGGLM